MIASKLAEDNSVDILSELKKDVKWIEYDETINLNEFEKVHTSTSADTYTFRSTINPDTFMKMSRESFF